MMASMLSSDPSQEKSLLKAASPGKSEHSLGDGRINGKRTRSLSEDISCKEEKGKHLDAGVIHKGLEAIASSLSVLSGTLGTVIEKGGMDVKKETEEEASDGVKRSYHKLYTEKLAISPQEKKPRLTGHIQMKVACDVAMAMSAKAKLLLRELKGVKAELAFTRKRCHELEEENKRLRESIDTGACDEEDEDLVRVQLETLLAEKARLAQENMSYARENEILHEVIQYHQLTLQDVMLLNDTLSGGGGGFTLEEDLEEDEHHHLVGGN